MNNKREPFCSALWNRSVMRTMAVDNVAFPVPVTLTFRKQSGANLGEFMISQSNNEPRRNNRGLRSSDLKRITTPLVRDNGTLRRASWEEALQRAAHGFGAAKAKHGKNALGLFSCSKSTNEMNYVAQKFIRAVIGTNNIDSCNRT